MTTSQAEHFIGIDIGGTKIWAGLVPAHPQDGQSLIVHDEIRPTPDGLDAFVDTLVELIDVMKEKSSNIGGVGISTAGTVDSTKGCFLGSTANLKAIDGQYPLGDVLTERTGLPVHMENDANAAAYGEFAAGGGKDGDNMVMVTLGTGVGTGLIINNQMIRGSHFWAGEGGHIAIAHTQDRKCSCGRWDCWEAYASGLGLNQTIRQKLSEVSELDRAPFISGGKNWQDVDTHDLVRAYEQGSPTAKEIFDAWHNHIAVGIRSLINLLDPDTVVIGGGMGQFVNYDKIVSLLNPQTMQQHWQLKPAELANQAGLVGAAMLMREKMNTLPVQLKSQVQSV